MARHGDRRRRRQAARQPRPSLQPGRAVPQGQPLPRPRVQPGSHPHAVAPHRPQGGRRVRPDDVGRRPDDGRRRAAPGHRHVRRRGRAPLQQCRQPEPAVGDGHRRTLLPPPRRDPARPRPVWPDRRRRRVDDQRHRAHPRSAGAAPQQADHPLGNEHAAHQPPPVADDRGRPCRRRQGRRHRSAAHDHRRRRRRVRPAAARHRRRPDAGDDARADPRRPHRRPRGSPPTRSGSPSWPTTSPSGPPSGPPRCAGWTLRRSNVSPPTTGRSAPPRSAP